MLEFLRYKSLLLTKNIYSSIHYIYIYSTLDNIFRMITEFNAKRERNNITDREDL